MYCTLIPITTSIYIGAIMNTLWTKGLKKGSQEAKDIQDAFKASSFLRRRMMEMLQSMLDEELSSKTSDNAYDNHNWAFKQADSVGYARAIKRMMSTLEEKEKNI